MGRSCPHCNSSEIDEDPARGDATCMNCGTVLEESRIVSDVQFQETGAGGHEIIGELLWDRLLQPLPYMICSSILSVTGRIV